MAPRVFEREKLKELERALDNDMDELRLYQGSMDRTRILSEKMLAILVEFDDRVSKLEQSIGPMHKTTQKLTRIHTNIEKSLGIVNAYVGFLNASQCKDPFIFTGPDENSLIDFLKYVEHLKNSLVQLSETNYPNAQKSIGDIKLALEKATSQLEDLYKKWLLELSLPISEQVFEMNEYPDLPVAKLKNIATLVEELDAVLDPKHEIGKLHRSPSQIPYVRTYANIRGMFMDKSLQPFGDASVQFLDHTSDNGKTTGYSKGNCPIFTHIVRLLKLMELELKFIRRILPERVASNAFDKTISISVDKVIDHVNTLINKSKKGGRGDFFGIYGGYVIIDMMEMLENTFKVYRRSMTFAEIKGTQLGDMIFQLKDSWLQHVKEMYEDIKNDSKSIQNLSVDGTVHEITSTTLGYLKRYIEYRSIIDNVFAEGGAEQYSLPFTSFGSMFIGMVEALVNSLDRRAQMYVKNSRPFLTHVFMLNNSHYIAQGISKCHDVCGYPASVEERYANMVTKHRAAYMESWKPVCEYINDITSINKATLTSKQKDDIKDLFKNFNAAFDERIEQQRSAVIIDQEYRANLIKDLKKMLIPLYTRFCDKYRDIEFTKNSIKYFKYDKTTMADELDKLFEGTV